MESKGYGLDKEEVLAIRLYSTKAFDSINKHLPRAPRRARRAARAAPHRATPTPSRRRWPT